LAVTGVDSHPLGFVNALAPNKSQALLHPIGASSFRRRLTSSGAADRRYDGRQSPPRPDAPPMTRYLFCTEGIDSNPLELYLAFLRFLCPLCRAAALYVLAVRTFVCLNVLEPAFGIADSVEFFAGGADGAAVRRSLTSHCVLPQFVRSCDLIF